MVTEHYTLGPPGCAGSVHQQRIVVRAQRVQAGPGFALRPRRPIGGRPRSQKGTNSLVASEESVDALEGELDLSRERIYLLLSMMHERETIERARELIRATLDEDAVHAAVGRTPDDGRPHPLDLDRLSRDLARIHGTDAFDLADRRPRLWI